MFGAVKRYRSFMTIARKHLIDYSRTCYYHCMSRCVRQGFNLQSNAVDAFDETPRQRWIEQRLLLLSDVFSIDLLSFAIMDNHIHTVIRANLEAVKELSVSEVLRRWSLIGRLPTHCQLYLNKEFREQFNELELSIVIEDAQEYRQKLVCISTFMKYLNSYIARRANKEDDKKGHFWEGRYKSQALLDEKSILACMAYVDSNPVRAGKYRSIEKSCFTSIKKRVDASVDPEKTPLTPLYSTNKFVQASLPFELSLLDYLRYINQSIQQKNLSADASLRMDKIAWVNVPNDFEEQNAFISLQSELVESLERQARAYSALNLSWRKPIAEITLERLRDTLYPFDKKPRPT